MFQLESPCQAGAQEIRVLTPDNYDPARKYRVVYVLPVEPGFTQQFGYGLGLMAEMNAHNKYDVILAQMAFEKEPWFGDHANNPKIRQATYLKDYVVPFIEGKYSTPGTPEGRLLFGFSKSGWGAFSLILMHPDFFGYAAVWDAPLLFDNFHFGMQEVFGDRGQLDIFRPDLLMPKQKAHFQKRCRLVLAGEKAWGTMIPAPGGGSHTAGAHALLDKEGVKHKYIDNLNVAHRWGKLWMEPTLQALMDLAKTETDQ